MQNIHYPPTRKYLLIQDKLGLLEKFRIRIVFVLVGHLGEDLIMMEKYISLVFFLRRLYWEGIFLIPLEDVLVIDLGTEFLPLKVTLQIHILFPLCSLTCDNQNLGQICHSFFFFFAEKAL